MTRADLVQGRRSMSKLLALSFWTIYIWRLQWLELPMSKNSWWHVSLPILSLLESLERNAEIEEKNLMPQNYGNISQAWAEVGTNSVYGISIDLSPSIWGEEKRGRGRKRWPLNAWKRLYALIMQRHNHNPSGPSFITSRSSWVILCPTRMLVFISWPETDAC